MRKLIMISHVSLLRVMALYKLKKIVSRFETFLLSCNDPLKCRISQVSTYLTALYIWAQIPTMNLGRINLDTVLIKVLLTMGVL